MRNLDWWAPSLLAIAVVAIMSATLWLYLATRPALDGHGRRIEPNAVERWVAYGLERVGLENKWTVGVRTREQKAGWHFVFDAPVMVY